MLSRPGSNQIDLVALTSSHLSTSSTVVQQFSGTGCVMQLERIPPCFKQVIVIPCFKGKGRDPLLKKTTAALPSPQ